VRALTEQKTAGSDFLFVRSKVKPNIANRDGQFAQFDVAAAGGAVAVGFSSKNLSRPSVTFAVAG
jgi:hypothetical protein